MTVTEQERERDVGLREQYDQHIDRVNRATDSEISEAMGEILRKQRQVNVLRPPRTPASSPWVPASFRSIRFR